MYVYDRKSDITMYQRCLLSDACAARQTDTCAIYINISFNTYMYIYIVILYLYVVKCR